MNARQLIEAVTEAEDPKSVFRNLPRGEMVTLWGKDMSWELTESEIAELYKLGMAVRDRDPDVEMGHYDVPSYYDDDEVIQALNNIRRGHLQ